MKSLKSIYSGIKSTLIATYGDQDIYMEAMKRGKSSKRLSHMTKPTAKSQRTVDVADWKKAVASATNPENPTKNPMYDIYDIIENDLHLEGVIETRMQRLLRSKFRIVNDKGETNEELTKLFKKPWFEEFMKIAFQRVFDGVKVIELYEMENDEFVTIDEMNPRHVKAELGIIVAEESDDKGWSYTDPKAAPYYIQVGKPGELGLNKKIAPTALAKIYAMGALSIYIEKYGVPYFWLSTESTDDGRLDELEAIMQNLGPAGYGIFSSEEELKSVLVSGDGKVMSLMRDICNSEISIVALGQDGTTNHADSNGTYGSLKVLTEVANDRHESDKQSLEYLVNYSLIPRMKIRSSVYAKLEGHSFEWDDFEELDQKDFIEAIVKLGTVYDLDMEQIEAKTGIKILGLKKQPEPIGGGDPAKK